VTRTLAALALVAALAVALVACADDGPAYADPTVVAIATRRCRAPNVSRGAGVVVAPDLVATAAHLVDGSLRTLEVDGRPGRVVALDRRSDLALVEVDLDGAEPARLADAVPGTAVLAQPDADQAVEIDRHVVLAVDDATDRETYRRDVVVFAPAVAPGTSGSPLLDAAGRLVAIVSATSDQPGDQPGETFAVSFRELRALLDGGAGSSPGPVGACGS